MHWWWFSKGQKKEECTDKELQSIITKDSLFLLAEEFIQDTEQDRLWEQEEEKEEKEEKKICLIC